MEGRPPTEAELVERARRGDLHAYGRIVAYLVARGAGEAGGRGAGGVREGAPATPAAAPLSLPWTIGGTAAIVAALALLVLARRRPRTRRPSPPPADAAAANGGDRPGPGGRRRRR